MQCWLYGALMIISCSSLLRYTQSTPTFGKEYVHIKLHLPVDTRHHTPRDVVHSKVVHHHYHKRRRPVQHYHSSSKHADDILEALIVSQANKLYHHHHDDDDHETFLKHAEHYKPADEYHVIHQDHQSLADHEVASLDDYETLQLHDHDDDALVHQSYYRPSKTSNKYATTFSVHADDSSFDTEPVKFHHIPKPYHQAEIEEDLYKDSLRPHFRPSAIDDTIVKYSSHFSADEDADAHYVPKLADFDESLDISAISGSGLVNPALRLKAERHKEPINIEYLPKPSTEGSHQGNADYTPDYVGKVKQVAEYSSIDGKKLGKNHAHSDYAGYDESSGHIEYSSHDEHSRPKDSQAVHVGGAIVDWPADGSGHQDEDSFAGVDSYSATDVQGVGSGGYYYEPPVAKIKK